MIWGFSFSCSLIYDCTHKCIVRFVIAYWNLIIFAYFDCGISSGAYTYVSELWRKKQSDVMRFLQRVRCWEYRQLPSIVRVTHPTRPDKARRLGYKAKQVNLLLFIGTVYTFVYCSVLVYPLFVLLLRFVFIAKIYVPLVFYAFTLGSFFAHHSEDYSLHHLWRICCSGIECSWRGWYLFSSLMYFYLPDA